MPQPQAGQAGQPETDHGEATQLGALTYTTLNGNLLCLVQTLKSLKRISKDFPFFLPNALEDWI